MCPCFWLTCRVRCSRSAGEVDLGGHSPPHAGIGLCKEYRHLVHDVALFLGEVLGDRKNPAVELDIWHRIEGKGDWLTFRNIDNVDLREIGRLDDPLGEIGNGDDGGTSGCK